MEPAAKKPEMQIIRIEIENRQFDEQARRFRASVSLEAAIGNREQPVHIQFLCHADLPGASDPATVSRHLFDDALRQAGRMPGFRRRENQIVVRPDAWASAS